MRQECDYSDDWGLRSSVIPENRSEKHHHPSSIVARVFVLNVSEGIQYRELVFLAGETARNILCLYGRR